MPCKKKTPPCDSAFFWKPYLILIHRFRGCAKPRGVVNQFNLSNLFDPGQISADKIHLTVKKFLCRPCFYIPRKMFVKICSLAQEPVGVQNLASDFFPCPLVLIREKHT